MEVISLLSRADFIKISLEINLFFQRIMKEHLFFIETNLQPVQTTYIKKADDLKKAFEQLLRQTVTYSHGITPENMLKYNEFVTPYTLKAEELTTKLTGASLSTEITKTELKLSRIRYHDLGDRLEKAVKDLNNTSLNLLEEVIDYKRKLLSMVLECKIFITLYPKMLDHLIDEAEYYSELLKSLQERKNVRKTLCEGLNFWNNLMAEHAQFIDGMLDPTEESLKNTSKAFSEKFEKLIEECIKSAEEIIIKRSQTATEEVINFKKAATEGLLKCEIKSIIPPLLADHVLREANHYIRILETL